MRQVIDSHWWPRWNGLPAGRFAFFCSNGLTVMPSDTAPIEVGVLFSQTGMTSLVERTQRRAVLLAVDEINAAGGVLGRELLVADGDPASEPRLFRAEATRLLDRGVSTIFGCYMSSTRRAVLPLIERRDALLFYPTLYEGFEFSFHCVYSGAAPNQNSLMLADYLVQHYAKRFYLVGSNYVFPYESNRIMRDLLQNRAADVIEERYIPMQPDDDDIARVIGEIRSQAPVTVFSTIVGDAAVKFYRAYARERFDPGVMPIASLTTAEAEVAAMGVEAAAGHVTSAPYFRTVETAANARFVAAYEAAWGAGAPISAPSEAAYLQVHLFAQAAERAGSTDRRALLEALPACTFEAPQGPVRVDGRTHHTYLWPRIGRVGGDGAFEIVASRASPTRPDPYLVEPEPVPWGNAATAR